MASVVQLINLYARKYGVDPRAALAVATTEGGLSPGAVGDQGTSFGPFQLHVGGALPRGRGPEWANSPAGIEYALRQMAQSGARGLTGSPAIAAIVRNFERPAAPGAEIAKAFGNYGDVQPQGVGPLSSPADPRAMFGRALLKASQSGNYAGLIKAAIASRGIKPLSGNGLPGMNNAKIGPVVQRVLAFAHAQVGKPYVWGGESMKEGGFDCSGLIDAAYRAAGVDFPGRLTTQSAMKIGTAVNEKNLRPGDMIIVRGGKHMVLYAGNGKVIAARSSKLPIAQQIMYQPMSAIRKEGIVSIRRVNPGRGK